MRGPGWTFADDDPRMPALRLLRPPAFLLLAFGTVCVLFSLFMVVLVALGVSIPVLAEKPAGMGAWEGLDTRLSVALAVCAFCGALVIHGALNALRLRSYGWCMVGAVAALTPLVPLCAAGIPLGLWMLLALTPKGVRSHFAR